MKVLTILGTRPEIIRLSRVIAKLDECSDHVLVHTGQNYDKNLNEVFFKELKVRKPDHFLNAKGSFAEQVGIILKGAEKILNSEKPDKVLLLGDTNSALSVLVAKRLGIPVYHMEAGNRCYDDRVPEEINRRVIDHSSDILMPYTERSRMNLLREGIASERIYVTGNPIKEVLDHYGPQINASKVLQKYGLKQKKYMLATLHRAENVDIKERLDDFVEAFNKLASIHKVPIIWSIHPHTRARLQKRKLDKRIVAVEPLGLFDFVKLEKNAMCVLTDSGTVQEECCIFKVPNVTLRDVTERPETIEVGSNILSGSNPDNIIKCAEIAFAQPCNWNPPVEYLAPDVSSTVVNILHGNIR
ncbi:MAG: UDP-N-acetylglucosamine 2-epimerase (non-hydrolyzing) [Euryarchaeota archaeon]|nr:UDP-N-acetylglucosamine 2-epimerase (non-hydrolyzing) [Euryarchaeota archaeon]MBU4038111.1 UDP-N-acetylglucosamine 2-epimerase (non-hydrolyzing) [Pseudomonadota bacterium]